MNENTRVILYCCNLDTELITQHLPFWKAHQCPITVFSPSDAVMTVEGPGIDCRNTGKRAYIGQESLDRQRGYMSMCLEYPEKFFLLVEHDALCLSPEIPAKLYEEAKKGYAWFNEVVEPRPHQTPYRKVAMHMPWFLTWDHLYRLLTCTPVPTHPITPYGDWWMTAHCWSAGIPTLSVATEFGASFVHPVKTKENLEERLAAYRRTLQ